MKYLYAMLNEKERKTWHDTQGEEFQEVRKKMARKYFAELNQDFAKLHPDNQRRIRDLVRTIGPIIENLYECGDVWMKDLHELQQGHQELIALMNAEIDRIQIEEVTK